MAAGAAFPGSASPGSASGGNLARVPSFFGGNLARVPFAFGVNGNFSFLSRALGGLANTHACTSAAARGRQTRATAKIIVMGTCLPDTELEANRDTAAAPTAALYI